jgi:hypothetical protein
MLIIPATPEDHSLRQAQAKPDVPVILSSRKFKQEAHDPRLLQAKNQKTLSEK